MKCPVCTDVNLSMTDRKGIEIDYCPQCRGVWLDRGELDKLIERSGIDAAPPRAPDPRQSRPASYDSRPHDSRDLEYRDSDHHRPRKKKSLLGELFDF